MIGYIKGKIVSIEDNALTIEANGIGFAINVQDCQSLQEGSIVEFFVETTWNSENGSRLYGFKNRLEKKVFKYVLNCSGVGPKAGMSFISELGAGKFIEAINLGDIKALSSVPGIGPKKAESIIFQLREKFAKENFEIENNKLSENYLMIKNIITGLEGLGYTRREVESVLAELKIDQALSQANFDDLFRRALLVLSRKSSMLTK